MRERRGVRARVGAGLCRLVVVLLVFGVAGCGGRSSDTVQVAPRGADAPTGSTVAEGDTSTDLVGPAKDVVVDHVGDYTWRGGVVLPKLPGAFTLVKTVEGAGTASVSNLNYTLVSVDGGYVLEVTFRVDKFSGTPALKFASEAQGTLSTVVPGGG